MEGIEGRRLLQPTLAELADVWFHRIVALYCLIFGVIYWARLIGLSDDPLWRFDLMPLHWQVPGVMLAVLFPFAGIGLWMIASWGPVIWLICAATETIMYGVFPQVFGSRPTILAFHLSVAALYAAFRIVIHRQKRKNIA